MSKNDRIPRGMVEKLIDKQNDKIRHLGLTARMVTSVVGRLVRRDKEKAEKSKASSDSGSDTGLESESDSDNEPVQDKPKGKPGRPKHTTYKEMEQKKIDEEKFLNAVSSEYHDMKKSSGKKKVPPGEFDKLIARKKEEHNMADDFTVKKQSIRQRTFRGRPTSAGRGAPSPTKHL